MNIKGGKNMSEVENLRNQIVITRRELKNIRQELQKCNAKFISEFRVIKLLLNESKSQEENPIAVKDQNKSSFSMVPIGTISSCFKNKNGIPRQPLLCKSAKATLEISKTFFTNPEHSLIGLNQFYYIWVLFAFHKNSSESSIKAKVHPPRLNGESVGVFSTRSPHRPCAIGLSLTKLDKIIGNTLYLSGVDMLDGTPVLDIKPYIPLYDSPNPCICVENKTTSEYKELFEGFTVDKKSESEDSNDVKTKCQVLDSYELNIETSKVHTNFQNSPTTNLGLLLSMPSNCLDVCFTVRAKEDIEKFHFPTHNSPCEYCLDFLKGPSEAKKAIKEVLQNDPRSVYRRKKCSDKLYYFEVDCLHITAWFDDTIAEVLRVKPVCKKE